MHVHEQPCPGKVKLTPAGLEPATSCLAGEDVTPPPPRPANLGIYMLCDNNKIVYDYCHLISFNLYKVSLKKHRLHELNRTDFFHTIFRRSYVPAITRENEGKCDPSFDICIQGVGEVIKSLMTRDEC